MSAKLYLFAGLLLAAASLTLASFSTAAPPKHEEKSPADYQAADVDDILTAYRLAEFGRKFKSPEALLAAAGLFRKAATIKLGEIKEQPMIEDENDAPKSNPANDKATAGPNFTKEADDLFDEARGLGAMLKINGLEAVITAAQQREYKPSGERGAVGGPKSITRNIGRGQLQTFHFAYEAGVPAFIGVNASTPLHVTVVRADNGNVVADGVITHGKHTWVPGGKKASGAVNFHIRVKNHSGAPGSYTLFTN